MPLSLLKDSGVAYGQPVNWSHPLNDGLRAWLLCLPGAGRRARTWHDLCGRHHGPLSNFAAGTPWRGPLGRPGGWGCLDFDGTDDFVQVSRAGGWCDFLDEKFTFAFWVSTDVIDASRVVICKSITNNQGYEIQLITSLGQVTIGMAMNGGAFATQSTTTLAAGAWYHVAFSCDGTTNRVYVNGVEEDTGATNNISNTSGDLFIGQRNNATLRFDGRLDDVRLYGRGLSAAEARLLYSLSRRGYPGVLNRTRRVRYSAPAAPAAPRPGARYLAPSAGVYGASGARSSLLSLTGVIA